VVYQQLIDSRMRLLLFAALQVWIAINGFQIKFEFFLVLAFSKRFLDLFVPTHSLHPGWIGNTWSR
jgi:hypothetical protein